MMLSKTHSILSCMLQALCAATLLAVSGCIVKPQLVETKIAKSNLRGVVVVGYGEQDAEPEIAKVEFRVQARGERPEDAMAAVEKKIVGVLAIIEGQGISRAQIRTDELSLDEQYDSKLPRYEIRERIMDGEKPPKKFYLGVYGVEVEVQDLSKMGPLLLAVVNGGVDRVDRVRFSLKDPEPIAEQARAKAMQDALAKAKLLAQNAGRELGPILSVATIWGDYDREGDSGFSEEFSIGNERASMPIRPGRLTVSRSVRVQFDLAEATKRTTRPTQPKATTPN